MKPRVFALTAAVLIATAATSRAQTIAPADSSSPGMTPDSALSSHTALASSIDATTAVSRHPAPAVSLDAARAATHQGMGQAKALMFVGAAGFVAGALIGGDGGNLIMIGSAIVGLYGLYQYLQ
jgi:hypothetical protein